MSTWWITLLDAILRLLGLRGQDVSRAQDAHRAHQQQLPEPPPLETETPRQNPRIEVVREPAPPPEPVEPSLPAIAIDEKGWMRGIGITAVPSLRTQPLSTSANGDIDGIVWHWTDTRGAGAVNLAKRIVKLPPPNVAAGSCHAWIGAGPDEIAQSVSTQKGSWHAAGKGSARFKLENGVWKIAPSGWDANSWAFGVEIENIGELRRTLHPKTGKQVWAGWPFTFDPAVVKKWGAPTICPEEEAYVHPKNSQKAWHRYTPHQEASAERILTALAGRYALRRENCAWGHCQIDPARRTDPGPLWMGSENGDGYTTAKLGTRPDGILHRILDRVFGKEQP